MEKFQTAGLRAAEVLNDQLGPGGRLTNGAAASDLSSLYKLPTLLLLGGKPDACHRLLNRIKKEFMQADGDFVSYPEKEGVDRKNSKFAMCHFWAYSNCWVAMAAHRLGRFDISYPAFKFCQTFYNPEHKMVCVTEAYSDVTDETTMDSMSTAHFGLLCLYMGDLETAKACGEGLLQLVAKQPDFDNTFYTRVNAKSDNILTTSPKDLEAFYMVKKSDPNQFYFFLGYHVIFMTKLYQASNDPRFLDSAKSIIEFALTCHESLCMFSFSHKLMYGAALLAAETKEVKYRRLAIGIGEYLLSEQIDSGMFCKHFDEIDQLDQSAEIGIWLLEIYSELKKIM